MSKILYYELRRLLLNKFFFAILAVTVLYSYYVLSGEIVLGAAGTAPFSGFSYGLYLSRVLPLLLIALLFFISFLDSGKEKQVRILTAATPVSPIRYRIVKCIAVITGFSLISLVVIGISLVFYRTVFRFSAFGSFIAPALLTLLPALLFVMGLGMTLGKIHPGLLYVLMMVSLLMGFLPLPYGVDLFGASLFGSYPYSLPPVVNGEPAFTIPLSVWVGKTVYSAAGILLISIGASEFSKQIKKGL